MDDIIDLLDYLTSFNAEVVDLDKCGDAQRLGSRRGKYLR